MGSLKLSFYGLYTVQGYHAQVKTRDKPCVGLTCKIKVALIGTAKYVLICRVRDIATFFEQPLQYGGCISDFQNHCCDLISKEVAAAMLKITNTASNLGLCCTSV